MKEEAVKILARARWRFSDDTPAVQLAARSPADLGSAQGIHEPEAAKALGVETIDWSTQMLLVVSDGTKSTGGFRVEITSVGATKDVLVVRWKLHIPDGIVTEALEHPAEIALVPRFDGKVRFERAPGPG